MNFVGPSLYSGIGQHTKKYMDLFPNSSYFNMYENINLDFSKPTFIFVVPTESSLNICRYLKVKCKNKIIVMTVCETETVHDDYGKIFEIFEKIYVPSYFCKKVLEKQFNKIVGIIPPYVPVPEKQICEKSDTYWFYHIGNVLDQRKNTPMLINAFDELKLPNCKLFIKATCNQHVNCVVENIIIMNDGLVDDETISKIHQSHDCYVSAAKSEGVGMSVIEACLNDKPVIVPDYGGTKDFVKTDFFVKCGREVIKDDDFLFKKGMEWGSPDVESLKEHMKYCYYNNIKTYDHSYTKKLVSADMVRLAFSNAQT